MLHPSSSFQIGGGGSNSTSTSIATYHIRVPSDPPDASITQVTAKKKESAFTPSSSSTLASRHRTKFSPTTSSSSDSSQQQTSSANNLTNTSSFYTHSSSTLSSLHAMTLSSDTCSISRTTSEETGLADVEVDEDPLTALPVYTIGIAGSPPSAAATTDAAKKNDIKTAAVQRPSAATATIATIHPSHIRAVSSASITRAKEMEVDASSSSSDFKAPSNSAYVGAQKKYLPLTPPPAKMPEPRGVERVVRKLLVFIKFMRIKFHPATMFVAILYLLLVGTAFYIPHALETSFARTSHEASGSSVFGAISLYLSPMPVYNPFLLAEQQSQLRLEIRSPKCGEWMESVWKEQTWKSMMKIQGEEIGSKLYEKVKVYGSESIMGQIEMREMKGVFGNVFVQAAEGVTAQMQHPPSFDLSQQQQRQHLYPPQLQQQQPHDHLASYAMHNHPHFQQPHRGEGAYDPHLQQHQYQQHDYHQQHPQQSYDPHYAQQPIHSQQQQNYDQHEHYAHHQQHQQLSSDPLQSQYQQYPQRQYQQQGYSPQAALHDPSHFQQRQTYDSLHQQHSLDTYQQHQQYLLHQQHLLDQIALEHAVAIPPSSSVSHVETKMKERLIMLKEEEEADRERKEMEVEEALSATSEHEKRQKHADQVEDPAVLLKQRREREEAKAAISHSKSAQTLSPSPPSVQPSYPSSHSHLPPSHSSSFRPFPILFYFTCSSFMLLLPWLGLIIVALNMMLSLVVLGSTWWKERAAWKNARMNQAATTAAAKSSCTTASSLLPRGRISSLFHLCCSRCRSKRNIFSDSSSVLAPPRSSHSLSFPSSRASTPEQLLLSHQSKLRWCSALVYCMIGGVAAFLVQRKHDEQEKRGKKGM